MNFERPLSVNQTSRWDGRAGLSRKSFITNKCDHLPPRPPGRRRDGPSHLFLVRHRGGTALDNFQNFESADLGYGSSLSGTFQGKLYQHQCAEQPSIPASAFRVCAASDHHRIHESTLSARSRQWRQSRPRTWLCPRVPAACHRQAKTDEIYLPATTRNSTGSRSSSTPPL
jgi:hypothetical protein